jgi:molecular chaperone GrpE
MKPDDKKTERNTVSERPESTGTNEKKNEGTGVTSSTVESKAEVNVTSSSGTMQEEKTVPLDKYLRLAADFDNYRKRVAKERNELLFNALKNFVLELLPVVDDFDRAIAQEGNSQSVDSFMEGFRMIHARLLQIFDKLGVTTWNSKGEKFDPDKHHALSRVISDKLPDNTVVEEIRRGYMLNGRIIRPAEVIVSSLPEVIEDKSKPEGETCGTDLKD